MTNWKSIQPPRPSGNRMRRRELMLVAGGAVMTPHVLFAEQKAMPVIGFLSSASPGPFAPFVAAFHQGLSETGYIEGQNLAIEYRWAEGHYDRLSDLAIDLVHSGVEVIATSGGTPSPAPRKGQPARSLSSSRAEAIPSRGDL
jgi:putative tryptophan/tyrosine transport system substrate-binding protein